MDSLADSSGVHWFPMDYDAGLNFSDPWKETGGSSNEVHWRRRGKSTIGNQRTAIVIEAGRSQRTPLDSLRDYPGITGEYRRRCAVLS